MLAHPICLCLTMIM